MAKTKGNPSVATRQFGDCTVKLGLHTGRITILPKDSHLSLPKDQRNKLVSWVYEWLQAYDCLHHTASPMSIRDQLFGGKQ